MKCQETVSDPAGIMKDSPCGAFVSVSRACGMGKEDDADGCAVEIGYCEAHGGMKRATEEMVAHHTGVHGLKCFGAACPCVAKFATHEAWFQQWIGGEFAGQLGEHRRSK